MDARDEDVGNVEESARSALPLLRNTLTRDEGDEATPYYVYAHIVSQVYIEDLYVRAGTPFLVGTTWTRRPTLRSPQLNTLLASSGPFISESQHLSFKTRSALPESD